MQFTISSNHRSNENIIFRCSFFSLHFHSLHTLKKVPTTEIAYKKIQFISLRDIRPMSIGILDTDFLKKKQENKCLHPINGTAGECPQFMIHDDPMFLYLCIFVYLLSNNFRFENVTFSITFFSSMNTNQRMPQKTCNRFFYTRFMIKY